MSVRIITSLGPLVVTLYSDLCPLATKNFLKLCKIKFFNGCLFHRVEKNFIAETGDPSGKGTGGDSLYRILYGEQARFFKDEIHFQLRHSKAGTMAMVNAEKDCNASQFYITLRDEIHYLDGKYTVFGNVTEGFETLTKINESYVDQKGRPYQNIRIKHTYILDDPFDDPPSLLSLVPDASPEGKPEAEIHNFTRLEEGHLLNAEVIDTAIRKKEAQCSALVLELVGDIPCADAQPPNNILFVCRLHLLTSEADLRSAFSPFGSVVSAKVICDRKTGKSRGYGFVEFIKKEESESALLKMHNAYIHGRRVTVDFCQSIPKPWSEGSGYKDQEKRWEKKRKSTSMRHVESKKRKLIGKLNEGEIKNKIYGENGTCSRRRM